MGVVGVKLVLTCCILEALVRTKYLMHMQGREQHPAEAQARTCDFDDGIFILRIENRTKRREGEAANLDDRG